MHFDITTVWLESMEYFPVLQLPVEPRVCGTALVLLLVLMQWVQPFDWAVSKCWDPGVHGPVSVHMVSMLVVVGLVGTNPIILLLQ